MYSKPRDNTSKDIVHLRNMLTNIFFKFKHTLVKNKLYKMYKMKQSKFCALHVKKIATEISSVTKFRKKKNASATK